MRQLHRAISACKKKTAVKDPQPVLQTLQTVPSRRWPTVVELLLQVETRPLNPVRQNRHGARLWKTQVCSSRHRSRFLLPKRNHTQQPKTRGDPTRRKLQIVLGTPHPHQAAKCPHIPLAVASRVCSHRPLNRGLARQSRAQRPHPIARSYKTRLRLYRPKHRTQDSHRQLQSAVRTTTGVLRRRR